MSSTWSPFAKAVTEIVPMQDGHSVTIRKLGWKALVDASNETQRKGIELAKAVGPGGLLAEITKQGGEAAIEAQANADPVLQFDRFTLLDRGIKAWTFSDKPTADEIADLDEDVAKLLARKIYDLSKPTTAEDDRKNA